MLYVIMLKSVNGYKAYVLLVKSHTSIVYVCVRMFQTILHLAGVSSAGVFADPSTPKQSALSQRREPELHAKTLKNYDKKGETTYSDTLFICCDGLSQSSML